MISLTTRCMAKTKIDPKKWDNHIAFIHFGKCKNVYRNGKSLKWWNILKKGDHLETIEAPKDPTIITLVFYAIIANAIIHPFIAIGIIGIATLAIVGAAGGFSSSSTAAGSSAKEYSSSSRPELTGASNDVSSSIIPVMFGKTQQTPVYGQLPYRLVGDGSSTNKLKSYFIANYKNVDYSLYSLEDTNINNYSAAYVDVDIAQGSSSFIGFDNCKSVDINEQLSYDSEGEVEQSNNYNYNHSVTFTRVKIDFEIQFTRVSIANFATKNFTLECVTNNGGADVVNSQTFAINSGDLTLVSGTTYKYNGSKTWIVSGNIIKSTSFYPTSFTRGNSTESTNELECIYIDEDIEAINGATSVWTNNQVFNQGVNYYQGTVSEVIQTSPPNTTEIDVFISFPQGLYTLEPDGTRTIRSAKITIDYKLDTASTWTPISNATSLYIRDLNDIKQALSTSSTTVSGNVVTCYTPSDLNVADQLFYRPIGMVLPEGKYQVRARSADFADKTNFDVGYPYCAEIQFRVTGSDVVDSSVLPKINQLAFTATAYKGLSGTLKKFNYIAEANIPIWNGTDWNTLGKSTNPAAIIRYLLTDDLANPRYISTDYIDNDTLVELYVWCETAEYKASGIISDEVKISEVLNNVLANCQAAMIPLFNGKHTFVIDKPDKVPTQMFNQHNSWDFKWFPNVGRQVEAIRASFLNNDGYKTDELTVYWWSNNTVNETPESGKTDDDYEIIKKEYKYVNDRASVLKIAEYDLTVAQIKRDNFEFKCNLEALNMLLLDRIYVSNTTNLQNESTGLIKSVITDSGNIIGFELYSEIEIFENSKIVIRSLDYENEETVFSTYDVLNTGNTNIVSISPVLYDGIIKGSGSIQGLQDKWHYDGDLFTLGQETIYDCLVTNIQYGEDMTATITARTY